jgi:bifunctional non-homologous end joining protein LigD
VPGTPFTPMLATAGDLPTGTGWAFELKWDGVRAIAVCSGGHTRLFARRGNEITMAYPELAGLCTAVGTGQEAVFDGEIVVLDAAGRPSFRDLAERMHVRDPVRAAQLAGKMPVTYMIFDLLRLDGTDLCGLPYEQRRAALEELDPGGQRWLVPPYFDDGPATEAASREYALEGVVAKRLASPYRPGLRSPDWIKHKSDLTGDFVVGGFRPGARELGALLVGVPGPAGRLLFRGRVGGGISGAAEKQLLGVLRPLTAAASPFVDEVPREDAKGATWVRPEVVVELRFGERTRDGRLRFPRFVMLRPDKSPDEVIDE